MLDVLGQGTFGRVYRARDVESGEVVALKEFVKKPGRSDGFLRELGISFELRHPNIVACRSVVMSGTFRYLVCEYMEDGSLRELLSKGTLGAREVVELLLQVARGVAHAHERNVIHRDLKPENILLTRRDGKGWTAKVSDFGIATLGTALGTRSSIGSPAYMAPEQFYDAYDARVDVYALGVLLYEAICGSRPFTGSPASLMTSHIRKEPELPEWIPRRFARIVKKAMAKKPERRFACADTLADALEKALEVEGTLLEARGWGSFPGLVEVAHARDEVLVRREADFVRLDRFGRLIHIEPAVDGLFSSTHAYVVVRGSTAFVRASNGTRAHRGLPKDVSLAIAREGAISFCHDGVAVVLDESGPRPVSQSGHADAIGFVGIEQTPMVASWDGERSVVSVGDSRIVVPARVTSLFGHDERLEIVARAGDDAVFVLRPGHVARMELSCGRFTCDGEAFYAVTDEGELACVNVSAARLARTRWESRLQSVSASRDRFIWATRDGRVTCA